MDFFKSLEEYRCQQEKLIWQGTFRDYLELVKKNPKIVKTAHSRIYDMIVKAGVEETSLGKRYHFFSREIFGLDEVLERLVEEYFHSAACRLDVRKRILLLMGPVSGGKSTIVTMLKRGLEEYTRTEEGAVYAIKNCPMHEEPMHLIPEPLRKDFGKNWISS